MQTNDPIYDLRTVFSNFLILLVKTLAEKLVFSSNPLEEFQICFAFFTRPLCLYGESHTIITGER